MNATPRSIKSKPKIGKLIKAKAQAKTKIKPAMLVVKSYCDVIDPAMKHHHDFEHGRPVTDDAKLFEILMLEINQAGLNWKLILNKRENFRQAYSGFAPQKVARYGEPDIARLLANTGIIRSRVKIMAAIFNAQTILRLQKSHHGFYGWLAAQAPLNLAAWVKQFKKEFKFVGPEIVNEFLMAIGVLPGAHQKNCPQYAEVAKLKPLFLQKR